MVQTYSFEQNPVNDTLLSQLSQAVGGANYNPLTTNIDASKVLSTLFGSSGSTGIGAQMQENAYAYLKKVNDALNAKYNDAAKSLQASGINIDDYLNPSYQLYNAGEGASANRYAPAVNTALTTAAKLQAIQDAQKAAADKAAGKQVTPPDYKGQAQQLLTQVNTYLQKYPTNQDYKLLSDKLTGITTGQNITSDQMARSNAAAARVGAPLPYPTQKIGDIAEGGAITNDNAAQAYQNGQLTAEGQKIVSSVGSPKPVTQPPTGGNTGTGQSLGSSGAMDLIKQVLQGGGDLNNLQNNAFWSSNPNKTEAYQILQNAFKSPQGVANLVQQTGITGLQNLPWWQNYSGKQDAWNIIQTNQATPGGSIGGNTGGSTGSGAPGSSGPGAGNTPGGAQNGGAEASSTGGFNLQSGLDIINNSNLDDGTKALFAEALKGWNPDQEINVNNIIGQFNKIKSETIDPYFAEQANIFVDQLKNTEAYNATNRAQELEAEGLQTKNNIQNAQKDLEARGMTFSGEAVNQLGQTSAYGAGGSTKQPWQMGNTPEGQVNTQNRLMASSSAARYQKSLQDLQRSAEQTLGTAKSGELFPQVQALGGVSGSLNQQKNAQYANTLSDIYNQQQQNVQQNKQINLFQ